jgi:SAM-dependent methyltransferase
VRQAYPDHERYRELYQRYYDGRDVGELLDLLEPLEGARVLELCGGDGRLSLAALDRGAAHVRLVDAEAAMVPEEARNHPNLRVWITSADGALLTSEAGTYDRIVCRQAVNYWLDRKIAQRLYHVLKPGGVFAFNTFNQKPPEVPRVLEYELDGHAFVEVSWLVDGTVHHLQVRRGLEPHYTSFTWLSPEALAEILAPPYFEVSCEVRGKTSLYRCVKK